ncbi:hypothetical protein [Vibrio coralliirubri]|uniref:hypothetical protein n=1 Tax=Vibrio coralliirubri TaxID=1516159 RepID=UPI002FDFF6F3
MKSYRIIEVSKSLSVIDIYDSIVHLPFDDGSGFLIHKKRNDFLEASHLYKKVVTKVIRDIEGNEESVTYHDYIKTNFKVVKLEGKPYIVVIEPPRESKIFNQDLKKSLPIFTSIRQVSKSPASFYQKLVGSGFKVEINEIELCNINILNKGLGRFVFSSENDIYKEAMSFVEEKNYDIKYMVMHIESQSSKSRCKVSSSGVISMNEYNQDVLDVYLTS